MKVQAIKRFRHPTSGAAVEPGTVLDLTEAEIRAAEKSGPCLRDPAATQAPTTDQAAQLRAALAEASREIENLRGENERLQAALAEARADTNPAPRVEHSKPRANTPPKGAK